MMIGIFTMILFNGFYITNNIFVMFFLSLDFEGFNVIITFFRHWFSILLKHSREFFARLSSWRTIIGSISVTSSHHNTVECRHEKVCLRRVWSLTRLPSEVKLSSQFSIPRVNNVTDNYGTRKNQKLNNDWKTSKVSLSTIKNVKTETPPAAQLGVKTQLSQTFGNLKTTQHGWFFNFLCCYVISFHENFNSIVYKGEQ